jgi:predicted transcriptional regulator
MVCRFDFSLNKFLNTFVFILSKSITMDANEIVLKTLKDAGSPMKAGDIAQKAGIEKKEVDKAIKKLAAENKIESPQRCFYAPKK